MIIFMDISILSLELSKCNCNKEKAEQIKSVSGWLIRDIGKISLFSPEVNGRFKYLLRVIDLELKFSSSKALIFKRPLTGVIPVFRKPLIILELSSIQHSYF